MRAVPEPFRPARHRDQPAHPDRPGRLDAAPDPAGELGVLQAAVFTGRRLRLGYRSSGPGAALRQVVDPYGLAGQAGAWYLAADAEGEPRPFRVPRVVSAVADLAAVAAGVVACYSNLRLGFPR